jgi:hypothetical protein
VRTTLTENLRRWQDTDLDTNHQRVRLFHQEPALEARYLEICQEWEGAVATIVAADRNADPDHDLVSRLVASATVGAMRAALRAWAYDATTTPVDHLETAFDHLQRDLRRAIMSPLPSSPPRR